MKSNLSKLVVYVVLFLIILTLLNIALSGGESKEIKKLMNSSPFFDLFKVCYSLSFLIIIGSLFEKSDSKKIDNNFLLKILLTIVSLTFGFLGYRNDPTNEITVSYTWVDYFKIIFFGSIWIGLYVQLFTKNKEKK